MVTQSDDIAWLGVGKMGLPIAGRIAAAGFRVTAFDVSADRMAAARQQGLGVAASAIEAVNGKSVVFTSLPDDKAVRDLLLVKGVLDAIALEHPKADDLLDFCRAENARIEAFCAEKHAHERDVRVVHCLKGNACKSVSSK